MIHSADSCEICKRWEGTLVDPKCAGHFPVPARRDSRPELAPASTGSKVPAAGE